MLYNLFKVQLTSDLSTYRDTKTTSLTSRHLSSGKVQYGIRRRSAPLHGSRHHVICGCCCRPFERLAILATQRRRLLLPCASPRPTSSISCSCSCCKRYYDLPSCPCSHQHFPSSEPNLKSSCDVSEAAAVMMPRHSSLRLDGHCRFLHVRLFAYAPHERQVVIQLSRQKLGPLTGLAMIQEYDCQTAVFQVVAQKALPQRPNSMQQANHLVVCNGFV